MEDLTIVLPTINEAGNVGPLIDALTQTFGETPVIVERVVTDIDEIVRIVRFDGWQHTEAGEREVKKALRSTLLKYKLHKNHELFDSAYEYIRQYY